jgi:hypothetical protein
MMYALKKKGKRACCHTWGDENSRKAKPFESFVFSSIGMTSPPANIQAVQHQPEIDYQR